MKFDELNIDERILRAVEDMGFEETSPIQTQAIPAVLEGIDVIGQAQTGTGKTAAYSIPVLQKINPDVKKPQAIVLCPTRELAVQVAEEIRKLAKYMSDIKVLPVYGGQEIVRQIKSLKAGVQIIVGTPGRVMDHMRRKTVKFDSVSMVILDEADEMLDMGFREDMETILTETPEERQTVLFSATMPKPIMEIARKFQKDAKIIKVVRKELTVSNIDQFYYEVRPKNKTEILSRLIDIYNPKLSVVFCNTKRQVDELISELKGRGYFADGIHGDMKQQQRDRVMDDFRSGKTEILIATDVAARGLDVDDVEAVFNFDIPQDVEYYVHRIGRTGRAGRKGRSFTLVVGREIYRIRDIERICNTQIKPRMVPSVADITQAKASQIFDQVMEVISNNDLSSLQKKVEDKIEEENITAMELCAGFLKLHLGDDMEEIPAENYIEEMRKKRAERKGGRSGRRDDRRGDDDRREGKGRRRRQTDEDVLDMMREHRPGKRKSDKAFDKKSDKKSDKKFEKKGSDRKRSDKSEKKSKGLFGKERTFKKNDIDKKTGKAKKWK